MQLSTANIASLPDAVQSPGYDRSPLVPSIVHIGVGGFHRSHLATYIDDLCRAGRTDWAILGSGVLPNDAAMADVLAAQDHLYTLLVRDGGGVQARVIGSIVGYVHAHPDPAALVEAIAAPTTAVVSLTVTEAGYPVDDRTGEFVPESANASSGSAFDLLVRGLARRREHGRPPLTVLSCDNVIGNGRVTRAAVLGIAVRRDDDLADWIDANVSFPSSMVDRITPGTTDADRAQAATMLGVEDRWPVVTEPFRQWVVEDRFAGARLPLEELDVIVTDDVEPYELFKLRLLNASHSCLAYLAKLAGHERVDQVMAEERFAVYLRAFLDLEAGPVVPEAPGIDLEDYTASLMARFANPAVGDQVDRLCVDGASKFPKFLMPTLRQQVALDGPIRLSLLALAGWCRYLQGVDDAGRPIAHAPDPHLDEARERAHAAAVNPAAFLGYERVFGDVGDDPRVGETFAELLKALTEHGVRATLDRIVPAA